MRVIERASHVPLYVQIEQELSAQVRSGKLAPYAQVPSELDLSERFSVSRMTARKALDRLVGEGIVFRQPGKGTFVAPPKIAHRASTQLSFSAAMEALGLQLTTHVLNAAVGPAPPNAAAALGLPGTAPVVFIQRLRIVGGQPAAIHAAYLPGRYEAILEEDLSGSLTQLTGKVAASLVQSRDAFEAVAASVEEGALLGVRTGSPLIRHEGIGFSAASEPLRYTVGLYRGDRFRFSIDTAGPPDLKPELKHG